MIDIVRNGYDGMKKVTKIVKPNTKRKKLKVAAYCRVSKDSDSLERSLYNQVTYFKKLIESNKEYEFVRVFVDNGISGTSTKKRLEFNEMIDECKKGNIDLILAKSISRFARNTVDLLNTIRYLKTINVEVRFEKENISTFSTDGEFMITLLAAFAEAESESLSSNQLWSLEKRMKEGKVQYIPTFGYNYKDHKYVINEKEAKVVRYIFSEFIKGKNYTDIARDIVKMKFITRKGNEFNYPQVKCILKNEKYTGKVILQKSFTVSPLTHQKKKNNGEKPKYEVLNAVPRIISDRDFEKAQVIIKELSKNRLLRHPLLVNKRSNLPCKIK